MYFQVFQVYCKFTLDQLSRKIFKTADTCFKAISEILYFNYLILEC